MSAPETSTDDPRCGSATCGRVLARPTKFCPYCGTSASGLQPDPPEKMQQTVPPVPETVPLPAAPSGTETPEPVTSTTPAIVQAEASAATAATGPAAAPPVPRRVHPILVAAGVAAALALLVLLLRPSPKPAATDMQATAEADRWTTLDLTGFALGARIAMSADGPFRIRSATDSPRLVSGSGIVDLGEIHRDGMEMKSANGRRIQVKIEVLTQ